MLPEKSPFKSRWPFIELKGYRLHPKRTTYTSFSYEALPPLPEDQFKGDFQWLESQPAREDKVKYWKEYVEFMLRSGPSKLTVLKSDAEKLGLSIPQSFIAFMGSAELVGRIRSVTSCHFELSNRIAPNPEGDGYFIHFLSDSQDCLFWNLFIKQSGEHSVVATWQCFCDKDGGHDDEYDDDFDLEDEDELVDESDAFLFCAPSFEAFIYRYWLENEIWYKLSRNEKLTHLQHLYVSHYQ